MLHKRSLIFTVLIFTLILSPITASAKNTNEVKLVSVGWTGVTIKTEMAKFILNGLGYKARNNTMSVPISYMALSKGDADIFFGNWMPSMENIAGEYFKKGTVIQYAVNMQNAKYTLAVPTYCADAGLKHFKDIVKFGQELEWKIYGIEPGNDGNLIIQDMIDKDMFGLKKFKLVQSSEVAMLAQVMSYAKRKKPIVFLGWSPHSMNERIDMTYLDGSTNKTFGGNNGTATVWTNTRKGFEADMPNVSRLVKNMTFPVSMINQIMTEIHIKKSDSVTDVTVKWLKANPKTYSKWLQGVTTIDGKPAVPAIEEYLAKKVK